MNLTLETEQQGINFTMAVIALASGCDALYICWSSTATVAIVTSSDLRSNLCK